MTATTNGARWREDAREAQVDENRVRLVEPCAQYQGSQRSTAVLLKHRREGGSAVLEERRMRARRNRRRRGLKLFRAWREGGCRTASRVSSPPTSHASTTAPGDRRPPRRKRGLLRRRPRARPVAAKRGASRPSRGRGGIANRVKATKKRLVMKCEEDRPCRRGEEGVAVVRPWAGFDRGEKPERVDVRMTLPWCRAAPRPRAREWPRAAG